MTLYSIIPEETVLQGFHDYEPDYMELTHGGITMQVERLDKDRARIVRLYSGNAYDYLNSAYSPGSIIQFRPFLG